MDCTILFGLVFIVAQQILATLASRHVIYWDSRMTESIQYSLKHRNHALSVEIGDFMDILCPHKNLQVTDDYSPPAVFDLYNVTEDGFKTCNHQGGRFIFACNLPDRENKLTIKFQTISPSPFGFRFQHCAEYYFMAVPRDSGKGNKGCTEKSERLRIKVGCKDEPKIETTTTTTTVPTTTRKSYIDQIKNGDHKKQGSKSGTGKETFRPRPVVPDIVLVTSKSPIADKVVDHPENSSRNIISNTHTTFVMVAVAVFYSIFVSS